jgi:hypothetical protein
MCLQVEFLRTVVAKLEDENMALRAQLEAK